MQNSSKQFTRIAIIGAGTMGTGIAINAAAHGIAVHLVDLDPAATERCRGKADTYFARQVAKGRMTSEGASDALARIAGSDRMEDIQSADLVIEAVFEDRDVKRETLAAAQTHMQPDAILATNTSALRLADLVDVLDVPERFLGLHYFSPAEINPLVEMVRGTHTSDATIAQAEAFLKATQKSVLPCRDQFGFAINRFFCPFTNEAARLLDEARGTPAQIDTAARAAFDLPMGPFAVMNIVKPRINLHAVRNLSELGEFYAPAQALVTVGEADKQWQIAESDAPLSEDKELQDRLRAAVFLPVLQLIQENVAVPAAVDMGAAAALRFGRAPCALMDQLGQETVAQLVTPLCHAYGVPVPASLSRVGSLVAPVKEVAESSQ